MSRTIVISAVNLVHGGTLTILKDCLEYLSVLASKSDYRIIAIVHDKNLALFDNIEYLEFKWPKKMWIYRLYFEYIYLKKVSKEFSNIDLWLSLHDTTPNVRAKRRAVYCHNPFAFYNSSLKELFFTPKIVLFSWFSKYIYLVNQDKNDYIVVQQNWFKTAMQNMFKLENHNIITAPPAKQLFQNSNSTNQENLKTIFAFASSPNSHKNFECICKAVYILNSKGFGNNFNLIITIKGDENSYAKWLKQNWGEQCPNIEFKGFLNRNVLFELYNNINCLIFPSKIETWGLPISEFAEFNKPMLLADLPYAHETAAGANYVDYFNPESPIELATKMEKIINGDFSILKPQPLIQYNEPFANDWKELFSILLTDNK